MGALIDKLWETEFEFYNYYDESTKELLTLYNCARNELEGSLNNEQKTMLEEMLEQLADYNAAIEKKAFSNGFSLGMRMASEALNQAEKLI